MANHRRPSAAGMLDGPKNAHSVLSVAHDFAALAAVFDRQLERVSAGDEETRSHILKAKAAAERGLQLSNELLTRIQSGGSTKNS